MISNNYQKVIVIGLIIIGVSYFISNSKYIISIEIPFFPLWIPPIVIILVSYFIMIFKKSEKMYGIGLIISGGMLFYNFFDIMILFLSKDDVTVIDILPGMMTHVLPEFWYFHYPGFVLIGVGIFYLWKSKNLKIKETTP